jgi:hypothetical protein
VVPSGFSSASWQSYNSSVSVGLPAGDAQNQVWIGLRAGVGGVESWQMTTLTLDTTAPQVVLTNPGSNPATVTQPIIQVQGHCPEPLSALSYDLNNANGLVTGLAALVTDQTYDNTKHAFTTTYFQCYDVDLRTMANTLTASNYQR